MDETRKFGTPQLGLIHQPNSNMAHKDCNNCSSHSCSAIRASVSPESRSWFCTHVLVKISYTGISLNIFVARIDKALVSGSNVDRLSATQPLDQNGRQIRNFCMTHSKSLFNPPSNLSLNSVSNASSVYLILSHWINSNQSLRNSHNPCLSVSNNPRATS